MSLAFSISRNSGLSIICLPQTSFIPLAFSEVEKLICLRTSKSQVYGYLVFSTWMAFGGNTCDLGSFGEETDEITDLHQILEEVLLIERGDGVASIKRRCRDLSGDGVWTLATASQRKKANLLEDKHISSVGIFDEVLGKQKDGIHVTWAQFGKETEAKDKFHLRDHLSDAFTESVYKIWHCNAALAASASFAAISDFS
ncbi:hypothetical protein Tco_0154879 [Tanacetum coccineum]